MGQILRDGAQVQVGDSAARLEAASEIYWPLIRRLMVTGFAPARASLTAEKMFQASTVRFAAVDGSEDQQLLGGLAVFWAGSYASTGTMHYPREGPPLIQYDSGFVEKGEGLASCVPIYVDTIPEVDPQARLSDADQPTIFNPISEQAIVDNSTIASWIMLFSELYLAYKLAKSGEYQIIILDRSLSGTFSSLIHDTSKRALWRQCAICALEIESLSIDHNELAYGRYHNLDLAGTLPARGDYLRYAILFFLQRVGKPVGVNEIAEQLGCSSEDRLKRLERYLKKSVEEGYINETDGKFSSNPRYSNSWNRIRQLVDLFGIRFFTSSQGNPLQIENGERRWMTTLDLAFLSLFTLNLLVEESLTRRILLVGITKDTTARDLISHLVPVGLSLGIWKDRVEHVATTDRMLLQAVSMFHHSEVPVPWASIEYDTSFQTIVPDYKNRGAGYVSGAVRNRIILERRFVKSYVQLDKSKSDDQFRSNVLFIDRLYHEDLENAPTLELQHAYTAVEGVRPILWATNEAPNPVQELLMVTLKAMTQQSLPEVFGHNKPLFIADKVAKAQRDRASEIVKATGHWLTAHPKLRKFSFYMNTFRSRRSEVEHARSRA